MGLSLSKIKTDKELQAAIGLSKPQFDKLNNLFLTTYLNYQGVSIQEAQVNLQKNFVFASTEELLFFVLFSIKNPTTLAVLGLIFEIAQSTADYNLKKGLKILHQCLTENGYLPAREFASEEEFIHYMRQEANLIIDVTEFKVERPLDYEQQKALYSGKKNT